MNTPATITNTSFSTSIHVPSVSVLSGTRVLCLYRVSSDKQLYYDDQHNVDIPMQRIRCREYAASQGWTIVCELQEEGVSGYKVRAADRDKIQLIKEYTLKKQFDILLVFMFDRIGRIADETPFVVEWLVNNGIRVVSVSEGEQKFETHTDRLLNYIRFWQADGESQKTSIPTYQQNTFERTEYIMAEKNCCSYLGAPSMETRKKEILRVYLVKLFLKHFAMCSTRLRKPRNVLK